MLYSPSRLKRPLRKTSDGAYEAVTWEKAGEILGAKLAEVKGKGDKLAFLSGDQTGSINEVLSAIAAGLGSDNFFLMPSEAHAAYKGFNELMGGQGQLGYDIENADMVLALGADILESWGTAVRTRRAFSASHPHGEEPTALYVYAGPVENNTAAVADQWIPIKPGTESIVAMGLANLLIQAGKSCPTPDFSEFQQLAAQFTPQAVEQKTGVPASVLQDLAKMLVGAPKPLVVTGSPFGQGGGAAVIMAGVALNMLLGNLNKPGGMRGLLEIPVAVKGAKNRQGQMQSNFFAYLAGIAAKPESAPDILIMHEANPVYAMPSAAALANVIEKIPFKVSFTSFLDETALTCDLVLPVPMGLERLDDVNTPYGSGSALYCLCVPVVDKPVFDALPAGDLLIKMAQAMGVDLGVASYQAILESKAASIGADFKALLAGEVIENAEPAPQYDLRLNPQVLAQALQFDEPTGVVLAPVYKLNFGTGYTPTAPFNTKTIRDTELAGGFSFINVNAATAAKLGVNEAQIVKVTSPSGMCKAKVHIFEGVVNDVAASPLGLGHTAMADFNKDQGANIASLLAARVEMATGAPVFTATQVKIEKA